MLNVSVRCLEVFVAVAEAGSFAAAADRLGISQPSVSDHIRALEARSGVTVVERRRGRAGGLTEAGTALLAHARTLLRDASRLSEDMARRGELAERRVVLACQRPLANVSLPPLLVGFARDHADYELATLAGNTDEVVAHLLAGTADVGCLLARWPVEELSTRVIGAETFVFVAAPSHPLAGRRDLAPEEVAGHKFLRAAHRSGFGAQMNDMLAHAGVRDTPVASRATESAVVRELAIAGMGILCTLEKAVRADVASGALTVLQVRGAPMRMEVRAAYSPRRPPREAARRLFDYIASHYG